MDKFTTNEINNVRNSVDIVEIISEYVPLISKGRNYFGVCPFHDDNHPSMSVSKEKQIYTCFSCGATGNVFNFLMDYKSISFSEALKMLADKSGIHLNVDVKEKTSPYSKLYEMYDIAFKFYQNNINTSEGKNAKEYLEKRNIDDKIIKEFGIGLSLSKRNLLSNLLKKKGFDNKNIIDSGLASSNNEGLYDMYYKRIMFPLYDTFGKVVGFSGRIYEGTDISKYINTKETEIFKKGELLYNFHRAREEARISKTIIIMEGFMDVIRAYTIGVKNVVATMGTAITKEQALLIKRLAPNVILLFDGDKAGLKATISCIKELSQIGVTPSIVRLEDNLDPDEYIQKNGKDSFLAKINNPMNIMDFKLMQYKENVNLESSVEKADYVKKVLTDLSKIDDEILREVTLQKISVDSSLSVDFLKQQLENIKTTPTASEIVEEVKMEKKFNKYDMAQRALIYYMLKGQDVINVYNNRKPFLPNEKYRHLVQEIVSYFKINGIINSADLITELMKGNKELVSVLGSIESDGFKDEYSLEDIDAYINVIVDFNIKNELKRIKEEMNKESDPMKKAQIAQKMVELKLRGEEK